MEYPKVCDDCLFLVTLAKLDIPYTCAIKKYQGKDMNKCKGYEKIRTVI